MSSIKKEEYVKKKKNSKYIEKRQHSKTREVPPPQKAQNKNKSSKITSQIWKGLWLIDFMSITKMFFSWTCNYVQSEVNRSSGLNKIGIDKLVFALCAKEFKDVS